MNKKNKGAGGFPTLIIIVLILGLYWFWSHISIQQNSLSYKEFTDALKAGEVVSVVVEQSKAVPTGSLELQMADGSMKFVSVSDVNEAQDVLKEAGIPAEQISITDICTYCNPELLFSHRRCADKRGNLCAFLSLIE